MLSAICTARLAGSDARMNANPNNNWRNLKLGDSVRIVRIPSQFSEPRYQNGDWEDTFALYRTLIAGNVVLTISEIDEFGRPWVEHDMLDSNGNVTSNALAVDDDSWVRID